MSPSGLHFWSWGWVLGPSGMRERSRRHHPSTLAFSEVHTVVSGLSCPPAQSADPNGSQFCSHIRPWVSYSHGLSGTQGKKKSRYSFRVAGYLSYTKLSPTRLIKYQVLFSFSWVIGEPQVLPCPLLFAPWNSSIEGLPPVWLCLEIQLYGGNKG